MMTLSRRPFFIAAFALSIVGVSSVAVFWAGHRTLELRTQALQLASMEQAVTVRATGAAEAFSHAIEEDWDRLVWASQLYATTGSAGLQQTLNTMVSDRERISWAGLADLNGIVKIASNGLLVGVDISERDWFLNGLNKAYAGDVHDAKLLNSLLGGTEEDPIRFFDLAVPVTNLAGETVGVLGVHVNARWAERYLQDIARSLRLDLYLVNADGTAVLGTDGQVSGSLDLSNIVASKEDPAAALETWPDGQEYATGVVPLITPTDMPSFNWRLVARISSGSFVSAMVNIPEEIGKILARDNATLVLRIILISLVFAACGLAGTAVYFRYRSSSAEGTAKATSERLAVSEQRFSVITSNATLPIAVLKGDSYSSVNEAAAGLLGYADTRELEGKSFIEISPDVQPDGNTTLAHMQRIEATLTSAGTARSDWTHLKKDGTPIQLSVLLTMVPMSEEREVIAILTDVTAERKEQLILRDYQQELERAVAERTDQLEQRNEEQNAFFEAAPFGIALVIAGKIKRSNAHLAQQFELGERSIQGQPLRVLFLSQNRKNGLAEAARAVSRDGVYEFVEQLRRRDGSQFWVKVRAVRLDRRNSGKGEIWVFEDITDMHDAEQSLIEAKDLADQTARLKSDFLSMMSHEIRTPLNSIIGFMELAYEGPQTEKQRAFISKAVQSGYHLLHIVNDVLDLSRAESGKLILEEIEFDLAELSHSAMETISVAAGAKGVEVVLDLAPDLPRKIKGDPLRIKQILVNFLSNAAKFTSAGEIVLEVSRQTSLGENVLRFCVSDTGIGLTEAQSLRLFGTFSQAEKSTARLYGGSGLGLAICKQLANLMGGEVGVNSSPGHGSKFWFDLKLQESSQSAEQIVEHVGRNQPVYLGVTNPRQAQSISKALTASGFNVLPATSYDKEASVGGVLVFDHKFQNKQPDIKALFQNVPCFLMQCMREKEVDGCVAVRTPVEPYALAKLIKSQLDGELPQFSLPKKNAQPPVTGLRVLIADDDSLNREMAASRLEHLGLSVRTAVNGAEAVKAVLEEPFDIIFMDHQMPVLDGLEASRRIRALGTDRSAIPIVAVTGSDRPEVHDAFSKAGVVELIMKPLTGKKLVEILNERFPHEFSGHTPK